MDEINVVVSGCLQGGHFVKAFCAQFAKDQKITRENQKSSCSTFLKSALSAVWLKLEIVESHFVSSRRKLSR